MPKMYLRLPSHKCKDSSPCNLYWFSDGTQLDFNLVTNCGTCQNFTVKAGTVGKCSALLMDVSDDFGCTRWTERVTQNPNPVIARGDRPCFMCGGKGYVELENWHENEVVPCRNCT